MGSVENSSLSFQYNWPGRETFLQPVFLFVASCRPGRAAEPRMDNPRQYFDGTKLLDTFLDIMRLGG